MMNKVKKVMSCMEIVIKKFFFFNQKNDIYHECDKLLEMSENEEQNDELVKNEEYINSYNVTTRWQTI